MQNHYWIIEEKTTEGWVPVTMYLSRDCARIYQTFHYSRGRSRIRKFVAA